MADQESWEQVLGIAKPASCNLKAACCAVATPSVSQKDLFLLASQGQNTCRDLLSVFIPHLSHEQAKAFYPEDPTHIDRVVALVQQQKTKTDFDNNEVVFYHCRYLGADRRCQVYEDRPEFCRNYPASPLAILVKGCGYTDWASVCRDKLRTLGYAVDEA